MASSNRLVVEVVGDTTKLTQSLNTAQKQISRFANSASRKGVSSTAADALLGDIRAMSRQADELVKKEEEVRRRSDLLNSSFARTGAVALGTGIAVNVLGRNLQELGGNAGKLGQALSDLSSGNLVGFVKGLQSINEADPAKIGNDLLKMGDAAKATSVANDAAAIGLDKVAAAAKSAAEQIRSINDAFVDNTKIRDSTSPGAISVETSGLPLPDPKKGRKGITPEQRNTFFDNDIARLLDRSQDGSLPDQVAKLRQIEKILKERQAATKDVTRRLRLGDEIVDVQRRRHGVEEQIEQNANDRAAAAKSVATALQREREAREKAADEARRNAIQAKQFRALGLAADGSEVVPGLQSLGKQAKALQARIDSGELKIAPKLASQFKGAKELLAGKFGPLTRQSREAAQELFDTIRGKHVKGDGPLTKTTSLNTNKILEGLGLSPEVEREARARLARFNSGGQGLAASPGSVGAFGKPIIVHTTVELDGQKVAANTTRHQQRAVQANPLQKRGGR